MMKHLFILKIMEKVFALPDAILFLTAAEKSFVEKEV